MHQSSVSQSLGQSNVEFWVHFKKLIRTLGDLPEGPTALGEVAFSSRDGRRRAKHSFTSRRLPEIQAIPSGPAVVLPNENQVTPGIHTPVRRRRSGSSQCTAGAAAGAGIISRSLIGPTSAPLGSHWVHNTHSPNTERRGCNGVALKYQLMTGFPAQSQLMSARPGSCPAGTGWPAVGPEGVVAVPSDTT